MGHACVVPQSILYFFNLPPEEPVYNSAAKRCLSYGSQIKTVTCRLLIHVRGDEVTWRRACAWSRISWLGCLRIRESRYFKLNCRRRIWVSGGWDLGKGLGWRCVSLRCSFWGRCSFTRGQIANVGPTFGNCVINVV